MNLVTTKEQIEAALKCQVKAGELARKLTHLEQCKNLHEAYFCEVYVSEIRTQASTICDATLLKPVQAFLKTHIFRDELFAFMNHIVVEARDSLTRANDEWSKLQ